MRSFTKAGIVQYTNLSGNYFKVSHSLNFLELRSYGVKTLVQHPMFILELWSYGVKTLVQ